MTYCQNCHMGVANYAEGRLCFYCNGLPRAILERDGYLTKPEAPCTDTRCTHRRGEASFNYRLHYFTDPKRAAEGERLRRKWDDGMLRQLGIAPLPILDFSQLGEAIAAAHKHYNDTNPLKDISDIGCVAVSRTPEERADEDACMRWLTEQPERRTCSLCKQPVVDGRCRCIIG